MSIEELRALGIEADEPLPDDGDVYYPDVESKPYFVCGKAVQLNFDDKE